MNTDLVPVSTIVSIDLGDLMPRIVELANNECRTVEQQVKYMFKQLLENYGKRPTQTEVVCSSGWDVCYSPRWYR